jgi:hypothetical protein
METPSYHRHILYGALVGGPNQSDGYADSIKDYEANEVATDYNAGYTALLAKMCSVYGGTPLANFPEPEEKEDEFFVEASINSSGTTYTEIRALLNNRSAWPARTIKDLSFNYYFDISEVLAAGAGVDDLTVRMGNYEFPASISEIKQYDGNIYYVNVKFEDGTKIFPGGQSEFSGEVQFRISAPQSTNYWDPSNDYSYEGLKPNNVIKTAKITVYDGDTLIFGTEPDGTTPSLTTPVKTPVPTITPTPVSLKGDMDLSGEVDSIDFGYMRQYLLGMKKNFTQEQLSSADMNSDGEVDSIDFGLLRKYLLGI